MHRTLAASHRWFKLLVKNKNTTDSTNGLFCRIFRVKMSLTDCDVSRARSPSHQFPAKITFYNAVGVETWERSPSKTNRSALGHAIFTEARMSPKDTLCLIQQPWTRMQRYFWFGTAAPDSCRNDQQRNCCPWALRSAGIDECVGECPL